MTAVGAVNAPVMTDEEIMATIEGMSPFQIGCMAHPLATYMFGHNYGRPIDDTLVRRAHMWVFHLMNADVPEYYFERVKRTNDEVDSDHGDPWSEPPF